ncbi:pitrilysin family protein [Geotalea sp. SG265]|uniref:M16 family metallopeptidase n=1 Tax=Geotalea sp. SG265 TaxID=2922867 RepID=UPI001FAF97A6|nr:pitrilysin family protein [Geotalea sp. SG265]
MITRHKKVLANGLRVVAVEMSHLHSVEIAVYVRVGGRNDPPRQAGLAHFVEHMLFRGNADYPAGIDLEVAFDAIGGSVNAATDEESTCYFSRVHPRHVEQGLGLFASMLLRPTLPGIEVEKRIITEEALEDINDRGEETNPSNLSSKMMWPGHPLGMPTIGYLETIAAITEEDLHRHLAAFYVPANSVVVIAGDIEAARVFAACERAFAGWSGPCPPPPVPVTAEQQCPQSLFVKDADSQVNLQIAFRGFARPDGRIMATRLIRRILCGGGSSRLHLLLREKLGIVYSVDASISAYDETGFFGIELATAPENLPLAVREILGQVKRLAVEAIREDELKRVKEGYFFDLEYSRDSTYEMQVRYGWGELMDIVRELEEDRAEAAAIDANQLKETAAALFAPYNLNLVVVGPWKATLKRQVEGMLTDYEREWLK